MNLMLDVNGVTESALIQLRSLPDEVAAVALGQRLRALESLWRRSFYERGIILHEVKQRLLWKHLNDDATGEPYTSFDRWVLDSAPQSRSDCYAALKAIEELRDIPREQLEGVSRCNISILQALSSKVRESPKVLDAAKLLSQREFVAMIEHDYPEMHIESRRMLHLNPVKSASPVIAEGFKLAMQIEGLTSREAVLEFWATSYIQEHQKTEAV
jgi:hypothetical protein